MPKMSTSQSYYNQKLYLNNLGVHQYPENRAVIYSWTENHGARGSSEVSSVLIKFLEEYASNVNHVVTYSDNCVGQNKNFLTVCALLSFITDPSNSIATIDMKFLTAGHSFLASDTDFAHIEKKASKYSNIYTPDEYQNLILSATIKDFEDMNQYLTHITNRKKNTNNEAINWHAISWT